MKVKTVGRGPDNNIIINDLSVSRVHLQLVQDDNGNVSVVDLGSTNGTYVNGNRITSETKLNPSDTLRIGDNSLPWQTYFPQEQTPTPHHTPMRKKIWWFVGIGALLILFIVGGVLIYKNNKKENEKERSEQEFKDELLVIKDQDYMILRDKKRIIELDALAEKNKRAEEAKQHAVEKKQVEKNADKVAISAMSAVKMEQYSVERERDSVKKEKDSVTKERDFAKKDAEEAKKKAAENEKIANELKEKDRLTTEFYQELDKAEKDDRLKEICVAFGFGKAKNDKERTNQIKAKFNSATDNVTRKKIIDTIKNTQKKKKWYEKK